MIEEVNNSPEPIPISRASSLVKVSPWSAPLEVDTKLSFVVPLGVQHGPYKTNLHECSVKRSIHPSTSPD